ncbi:alpha/beta fold hydrolase [Nocardia inohanensis]|uniref:alpha/beta fold hydrolase n=1 Tax=Nocardia inohanensis TaxID=209246 RepID=UPI00082F1DAF|nr:alpha/beta fold hydrolase [Nocardia inohanensis]
MRIVLAAALSLLFLTAAPASGDDAVLQRQTRVGSDAATVWYPAHADHRLPIALMLPGANMRSEYYARFASAVADYGFIVVIPERYAMPGYSLPNEESVTEVLTWAREQTADPSSPLRTLADPETLVVAGHSYGGATALYAAADRCQPPFCFGLSYHHPPQLKAIVGHGTNTTIGNFVDAVAVQGIPVLYINGTDDTISEPAEAHESFASLTGAPAAEFVNLLGANHFGLADQDNPPGAAPDSHPGTAPRDQTITTAARWTAMWFLAQLGDETARSYVYDIGPRTDSAVRVEAR